MAPPGASRRTRDQRRENCRQANELCDRLKTNLQRIGGEIPIRADKNYHIHRGRYNDAKTLPDIEAYWRLLKTAINEQKVTNASVESSNAEQPMLSVSHYYIHIRATMLIPTAKNKQLRHRKRRDEFYARSPPNSRQNLRNLSQLIKLNAGPR
jgi:hypothetical protein